MTGNLTALVQNLVTISNTRDDLAAVYGPAYAAALKSYWAGDLSRALDQASTLLAEDPDGAHRFAAYRLWIEVLAAQQDLESLAALGSHLFLRGQAEPDFQPTYVALRGLVHFERDEIDAARLVARAFVGETTDVYGLELGQLVRNRTEPSSGALALLASTAPLADYFHWQTLARGLLAAGAEEALGEALGFVRAHFRGATLPHVFEFHRCIDNGYYAGASLVAGRLVELYPESTDYRYYLAYALYEDGDYPSARRTLGELLPLTGGDDAEVLGLLGHCNAKLGDPEKAAHYLGRAVALLKAEGLPTSHMSLELTVVEEELRGDVPESVTEMPRLTRNWLIKLSSRRALELLTSPANTVDRLLRPMGAEAMPGDYCFFVAEEGPQDAPLWKIIAIYAVDSAPIWHPTYRYHTALRLVKRLPEGIPLDVATDGGEEQVENAALGPDHPLRFGVYELDMGALAIIEEAARMARDELIERRADSGRHRRPTA